MYINRINVAFSTFESDFVEKETTQFKGIVLWNADSKSCTRKYNVFNT